MFRNDYEVIIDRLYEQRDQEHRHIIFASDEARVFYDDSELMSWSLSMTYRCR